MKAVINKWIVTLHVKYSIIWDNIYEKTHSGPVLKQKHAELLLRLPADIQHLAVDQEMLWYCQHSAH